MIKKLLLVALMALPLSLAAQNLKFGTVNSIEVFNLMPEKAAAEQQFEALQKQYENEFMKMQEEFSAKYKEFIDGQETMPENIKQRRMQEIQEIQQRIQNFREVVASDLEEQQAKLMAPIQDKIATAIKVVGDENGFTFIFDINMLMYSGGQAIDATPLVKAKLGLK